MRRTQQEKVCWRGKHYTTAQLHQIYDRALQGLEDNGWTRAWGVRGLGATCIMGHIADALDMAQREEVIDHAGVGDLLWWLEFSNVREAIQWNDMLDELGRRAVVDRLRAAMEATAEPEHDVKTLRPPVARKVPVTERVKETTKV